MGAGKIFGHERTQGTQRGMDVAGVFQGLEKPDEMFPNLENDGLFSFLFFGLVGLM